MKINDKSRSVLYWGVGYSILFILIVYILHINNNTFLKIDYQWLLVSGVPLLVALFIGGYITKFKGLGVEIESTLHEPLASINLTILDIPINMPDQDTPKEERDKLDELSVDEISNTRRLSFIVEKADNYSTDDVIDYFRKFNYLEFIEVKKLNGEFVCLIPLSEFQHKIYMNINNQFNRDMVDLFLKALGRGTLLVDFAKVCITLTVRPTDDLISVLQILRSRQSELAVVVLPMGSYSRIVTAHQIEKKIADAVLKDKNA